MELVKLLLSLPDLQVCGWFGVPKGGTWWADTKKKSLAQDNPIHAPSPTCNLMDLLLPFSQLRACGLWL